MYNRCVKSPPCCPPFPQPTNQPHEEKKQPSPFSGFDTLLQRFSRLLRMESMDTGDLILLALLFLLWQEKADEELIIALALLLIL